MNKGVEMINKAMSSGQHALVSVRPREQALDFPPSAISPECLGVLRCGLDAIGLVGRDQFNAFGSKPVIARITVVGAISDKSSGLRFSLRVASTRVTSCGEAEVVCTASGRPAASAITTSFVPLPRLVFPTTKVPSIKHSERLILPRSYKSRAKASTITRNTSGAPATEAGRAGGGSFRHDPSGKEPIYEMTSSKTKEAKETP